MNDINSADLPSPERCYVHIPGVVLEGIAEMPFSQGRLASVPFDTWRELDDWVPGGDGRKYARGRPVFYVIDLDVAGGLFAGDGVRDALAPLIDRIVTTLLLTTGVAFPDPLLSMIYVHHPQTSAVRALVGPAGRNALLGGVPSALTLKAEMIERLQATFDFVTERAHVMADPHIEQAVAALRRAALPEYRPIDGLVHATVALEALVASTRPGSGITAAFIERSAMLIASTREEAEECMNVLEIVYDLRSSALHGQRYDTTLAIADLSRYCRAGLARAVVNAMAFIGDDKNVRSGLGVLRRLLARARRDEEAWAELRLRCRHVAVGADS